MCLLRLWKTGFLAKEIADLLSTDILVGSSCGNPNFFIRFRCKIEEQTHEVAAKYSASYVDRVIMGYLFDIHMKALFSM